MTTVNGQMSYMLQILDLAKIGRKMERAIIVTFLLDGEVCESSVALVCSTH